MIALVIACIAVGMAHADLNDGLVVYYMFEGNADDSSGNGNHGTELNGVTYTDGVIGQAASFDKVDDHIDMGVPLGGYAAVSVFAWVKAIGSQAGNNFIQAAGWYVDDPTGTDGGFHLSITNGYMRSWIIEDKVTYSLLDGPLVQVGEWYLMGLTWDGSTHRLYLDGVEVASEAYAGTMDISTKNALVASKYRGAGLDGFFNGQIDELRIYDRALSESEIQALYDGLIAYYEFEGNADDSSGNDYHGTTVGNPSFVNGIFGQAINLDELAGQYVDTNEIFGGYVEFSEFAWAKMDSEVATLWRSIIYSDHYPSDALGHQGGFFINVNQSGSIDTSIVADDGTLDRLRFAWPTVGEWFFVGHTWDGTTHRAYLNGEEVLSSTYNKPIGTSGETTLVGAQHRGGIITRFFDGAIDDLRIYNRVLPESEIQALYASGTQSNDDGGGGGGGGGG